VQLVSKISNLCDPDPPTLQTDRQTDGRTDRRTDGRTTCNLNTALCTIVHRAVKMHVCCRVLKITIGRLHR